MSEPYTGGGGCREDFGLISGLRCCVMGCFVLVGELPSGHGARLGSSRGNEVANFLIDKKMMDSLFARSASQFATALELKA